MKTIVYLNCPPPVHLYEYVLGIVCILMAHSKAEGPCDFHLDLIGNWTRSRDNLALEFTEKQVAGLRIKYHSTTIDIFNCTIKEKDIYVISAQLTTGEVNMLYSMCWKLKKVTRSVFMMFELTETIRPPGFHDSRTGHLQQLKDPLLKSSVCTFSNDTELFTAIIRKNATVQEMASKCPDQLIAKFTYGFCPTTLLNFCERESVGAISYKLCSHKIFYSSGKFMCMGHIKKAHYYYLQIYEPPDVYCFKFPETSEASFEGFYFQSDCSGTSMLTPKSITLTVESLCSYTYTWTIVLIVVGSVTGLVVLIATSYVAYSAYTSCQVTNESDDDDYYDIDEDLEDIKDEGEKEKVREQKKQEIQMTITNTVL